MAPWGSRRPLGDSQHAGAGPSWSRRMTIRVVTVTAYRQPGVGTKQGTRGAEEPMGSSHRGSRSVRQVADAGRRRNDSWCERQRSLLEPQHKQHRDASHKATAGQLQRGIGIGWAAAAADDAAWRSGPGPQHPERGREGRKRRRRTTDKFLHVERIRARWNTARVERRARHSIMLARIHGLAPGGRGDRGGGRRSEACGRRGTAGWQPYVAMGQRASPAADDPKDVIVTWSSTSARPLTAPSKNSGTAGIHARGGSIRHRVGGGQAGVADAAGVVSAGQAGTG